VLKGIDISAPYAGPELRKSEVDKTKGGSKMGILLSRRELADEFKPRTFPIQDMEAAAAKQAKRILDELFWIDESGRTVGLKLSGNKTYDLISGLKNEIEAVEKERQVK
jgi:hypothetical protein